MSPVCMLDVLSLLAILVALPALWRGRRRMPGRDIWLLLASLTALILFRNLSNVLEWSRVTSALDQFEDYSELLLPVVYLFVLHAFSQRQGTKLLRESEERYRDLVENLDLGVTLIDSDYRVVMINGTQAKMFGKPASEFSGKHCFNVFERGDAVCPYCPGKTAIASGKPARLETEVVRDDGRRFDVGIQAFPVMNAEGVATGFVEVVENIGERKRAERMLQSLVESTVGVTGQDCFDRITAGLCKWFGADCAIVGEIVDGGNVRCLSMELDGERVSGYEYPLVGTPCENVEQKGYCVFPQGVHGMFPSDKDLADMNAEGYVGAPICDRDGRTIGILCAISRRPVEELGRWRDVIHILGGRAAAEIQRTRAEEALQLTQFSVDRSTDAVYWVGPDARFIYVNDAACRALGYTREEYMTMTVYDIDPDYPPAAWAEHWAELQEKEAVLVETAHRRKDGTVFPVEISANYLEFGGREYNCAFARDITLRKRAEEERLSLERQVQQAQKLESLGVLAGGIAHDFNNLLMAILGNADIALHELSSVAPARGSVEEIVTAARRAADLAKQMLAYSGRGQFVIEPIHVNELVEEMGHLLQVSVSKKAVLKYNFAQDIPAFDGDATQVRQIIMNLITNASEAIGDKSGIVSISTGAMYCDRAYLDDVSDIVRAAMDAPLSEGLYVYVEVADTGCGMDRETVEKVFDPFFTTKFTGRGLGMAAVLGMVRGHGGAIKIYTEVGKGTTFKILFPATEGAEAASASYDRENGRAESDDWRGSGTVLIADDEETVRSVARLMLERVGFAILTASDGREAVDMFRQHADEICCVLLDLTMPHLDGEQTFLELRRICPDVAVILSSGYNERDATERFAGKGLAGFIHKPYTSAQLIAKVKEAICDRS